MCQTVSLQRSHTYARAFTWNDHRLDDLAALVIGNADHRCLCHSGECSQDFFDLGGKDQEPGSLDDVFLAVDDGEVAIPIAPSQISGVKPAAAKSTACLARV